jgi:hypothetical protein
MAEMSRFGYSRWLILTALAATPLSAVDIKQAIAQRLTAMPAEAPAPAALKDAWIRQQKLTAADGAPSDVFGYSVAVSGNTAIIGAAGKTIGNNTGQGAVYVFTCSGTPCTWTQQQELTAADGASRDEFGTRVAVSGNTVIIGNNSSQGAAYVFTCTGAPCSWRVRRWWPFRTRKQQQKLIAADGAHGDEFGYSVAVSGNTAVIGAAYKNSYQGAAYVFDSSAVAITGPSPPP